MTSGHFAAMLPLSLGLAACASATGSVASGGASERAAGTLQMPMQIARMDGEESRQQTVLAYLPNIGFVRGTPEALATVGRPLPVRPGPNRTVEACRAMVEAEAVKLGARQVEAVSAGRERRDVRGRYVGRVLFRITYQRVGSAEVRLATLTCIVDRSGALVAANV
jgi:hypothetical protein